jgi:hypothetical protein
MSNLNLLPDDSRGKKKKPVAIRTEPNFVVVYTFVQTEQIYTFAQTEQPVSREFQGNSSGKF